MRRSHSRPRSTAELYTVTIKWNLSGQRYYAHITDQTGTVMLVRPLIGSPNDRDISLTQGVFVNALIFRATSKTFQITPTWTPPAVLSYAPTG